MKRHLATIALCSTLAASAQQSGKKPVYRDAATHDQIVRIVKVASQHNPMENLLTSEGEDPSIVNQPTDIISSSDIISFNGLTTLVPKRAILQTPANFQDRINNHQPGNRIVNWVDFMTRNRGWITSVEVTREQAEGHAPIARELADQLAKSRNLIVAAYQAGPISVLPLKEPVLSESDTPATAPEP